MVTAPAKAIAISDWKPYPKGTLQGFFTAQLPSGMIVRGCSLHTKNGASWLTMPSEKFPKQDGSTGYKPVVEFVNRSVADKFRDQVIDAIDRAGLVVRR
jgi:hypothetical protein